MQVLQTEIDGFNVLIQIPQEKITITESDTGGSSAPMGRDGESMGLNVKDLAGNATQKLFDEVSQLILKMAENLKTQFNDDNTPDQLELEFSLLLGGEAKIVIVSSKAEATMKVRMQWNK
jgi:hypothetical protein